MYFTTHIQSNLRSIPSCVNHCYKRTAVGGCYF